MMNPQIEIEYLKNKSRKDAKRANQKTRLVLLVVIAVWLAGMIALVEDAKKTGLAKMNQPAQVVQQLNRD